MSDVCVVGAKIARLSRFVDCSICAFAGAVGASAKGREEKKNALFILKSSI